VIILALIQIWRSEQLALRMWERGGINCSGLFGISISPESQSMVGLTFFNHGSPSIISPEPRSVTKKLVGSFHKPIVSVRCVK
jgi:hypothetical protein